MSRICSISQIEICFNGAEKHLYYECMVHWFKHFPAEQIYVVQFEELTYSPDKTLKGLKLFLGLDPEKPKRELDQVNARPSSSGWKMNQSDYEGLVSIAKDDLLRYVVSINSIVSRHQIYFVLDFLYIEKKI